MAYPGGVLHRGRSGHAHGSGGRNRPYDQEEIPGARSHSFTPPSQDHERSKPGQPAPRYAHFVSYEAESVSSRACTVTFIPLVPSSAIAFCASLMSITAVRQLTCV